MWVQKACVLTPRVPLSAPAVSSSKLKLLAGVHPFPSAPPRPPTRFRPSPPRRVRLAAPAHRAHGRPGRATRPRPKAGSLPQPSHLRHCRASCDLPSARMRQRPPFVFIPGEAGPAPGSAPSRCPEGGSRTGAAWKGGAKGLEGRSEASNGRKP